MINILSTIRTAPDLCKNVLSQYDLVAMVNHMQFIRSLMSIHTHTHTHTYVLQYRDAGRAKEI